MPRVLSWGHALAALSLLAPLAASATGLLSATGCDASQCNVDPAANPPADFKGGVVVYSDPDNPDKDPSVPPGNPVYLTSAPNGEHLNFNAGAQYRLFHGLGGCPLNIEAWVSFSRTGVDGGNEARPAGNMFEILGVDDTSILVRNDSCGDYWLRVIASNPVKGCGASPTP